MKFLIIFLIVFSFTMTAHAQEQQESTIVLKDHFIGDFNMAASGNDVFVVWVDFDGDKSDVFLKQSADGGTHFSEGINLSESQGHPREPVVTVSGDYVYVAWYEDTKLQNNRLEDVFFAYSSDGGRTFSKPINISKENHYTSATSNYDVDIAAVGKNVYIVWLSGQHDWFQTFLASSNDGGKTIQTKRLSFNDDEISQNPIVVASESNVYVGWSQGSEPNVYHAKMMVTVSNDDGNSFGKPVALGPPETTSQEQTLYAFGNTLFVSWRDEVDERNISYVKSSDGGKTFSEFQYIAYGARPSFTGKGSVFVTVWCGDDAGLDQICVVKSPDGGNIFSEQLQVSNIAWTKSPYADAPTPAIASQNQTLYVSWKYPPEGGGKNNLYLVTSSDGGITFSKQEIVGVTDEDPKMIVSQDRMYLLWADDLGEKENLNLLAYSHPYSKETSCPDGTELVDDMCQTITIEKTKTVGDDAPFFGIFVYLDDLISWLFGR